MTALDEFGQLVHDCPRLRDVWVFALERQAVAAQQDRDPEAIAESVEHPVAERRQLGRYIVGNRENFLHSAQCRRST
jgi:hypothetical protein